MLHIEEENYGSADSMFQDLGQFKAYISKIDSFDQLYIIQQGGRGVTRNAIIHRLRSVLTKDKNLTEVFNVIWKNENLRHGLFGEMDYLEALKKFIVDIKDDEYNLFRCIITTQ